MAKSKKICLWSGPRNISTALMYSFAQRNDTKVFDEPLYAHYLANTDAKEYHPGSKEVLESQNQNGKEVIENMLDFNASAIGFYKHMTHHLLDLDRQFLKETANVILTREPAAMIRSFSKVIPNPKLEDLGYTQHMELLKELIAQGLKPIVIDSNTILQNPKEALTVLCQRLEIDFQDAMLKWESGARPEDGAWAKYWYQNVHQSTAFKSPSPSPALTKGENNKLYQECLSIYERLLKYSI